MLTLHDRLFITDEQVEPLIRRIEGLQAVITRMKADQATLAQAEGLLRGQIAALHQERTTLAIEIVRHEDATVAAREGQQRHLKQLQDARETISDLEKKLAVAVKPSLIPKPHSGGAVDSTVASSAGDQAKRSQTQLLRARSKNNNPPDKSQVCYLFFYSFIYFYLFLFLGKGRDVGEGSFFFDSKYNINTFIGQTTNTKTTC